MLWYNPTSEVVAGKKFEFLHNKLDPPAENFKIQFEEIFASSNIAGCPVTCSILRYPAENDQYKFDELGEPLEEPYYKVDYCNTSNFHTANVTLDASVATNPFISITPTTPDTNGTGESFRMCFECKDKMTTLKSQVFDVTQRFEDCNYKEFNLTEEFPTETITIETFYN